MASYVYDGDGTLVKKVANSQTTVYVGTLYEKNLTTGVVTKYYYLGGQRVAMQQGGTRYYLHSDHLGSASLVTNASGGIHSQMRYYPYGETRSSSGTLPTDRRFTGQRDETVLGLIDFVARRYDPYMGLFVQPDTIIPDTSPQAFNRYTYASSNPLRYRDPTGHWFETALDVLGIAWDIYDIKQNGLTFWTGAALAVDVACLVLPIATGGGAAVRAVSHADDVVDAARAVDGADMLIDTARTADALDDLNDAGKVAAEGAEEALEGTVGRSVRTGDAGLAGQSPRFAGDRQWMSHFDKHGAELGYGSAESYLRGAQELVSGGDGIAQFVRANGDTLFYNVAANEFAVLSGDGVIRTFFSPDNGLEYWLRQTGGQ